MIEKHTKGALPFVKLQPLSPNELTQPRSSSRARFSLRSLINPRAPALASARLEPSAGPKPVGLQISVLPIAGGKHDFSNSASPWRGSTPHTD